MKETPAQWLSRKTDRALDFAFRLWRIRFADPRCHPNGGHEIREEQIHRGTLFSISNSTLFMRSVGAALGSPPKYSKASIKQ